MEGIFERTELLLGQDGLEKLKGTHIAVFGIGGVGSFAAESLVRSGIGEITLIDFDDICVSNINRQIHANIKTVGRLKVDAMKERLLLINPDLIVNIVAKVYSKDNSEEIIKEDFDYVVDAIDMISSKIHLIKTCKDKGIPIISSMGTGNKLDPSRFEITDIYKTSVCPLAKVMRRELKKLAIKKLDVVYSKEVPITQNSQLDEDGNIKRKQTPGSIAFVPPVSGMIMASFVIRQILSINTH
ncbi:MAG: tRNA threonylcarbamoyladenosine dehydratase [Firmicutes bacterium]|jgi:tRNA A37 threonylcarbamoyladenosine dehydratase|nr:tRNA threonylcarbamoyladenosine dehydratase [Bacillota bacterium]